MCQRVLRVRERENDKEERQGRVLALIKNTCMDLEFVSVCVREREQESSV